MIDNCPRCGFNRMGGECPDHPRMVPPAASLADRRRQEFMRLAKMYRYHNLREASNDAWRLYESEARTAIAAYRDAEIERLTAENDKLLGVLEQHGFRRCDIAACNCGSWHHIGGFAARFREIEEATEDYWENGEVLLARIERIVAKLEAAERDAERYREWKRAFDEPAAVIRGLQATIARQRAWIESAGHRPGCASTRKCAHCGKPPWSYRHLVDAVGFDHDFQPGPCDCGWAELAGG